MVRRLVLTAGLLVGCFSCFMLVTRADSAQSTASAAPPFKPVASVHSLMEGQGAYFKQISEALANPAAKRRAEDIFQGAEMLAELANVNTYNSEKEDYRRFAGRLRDTSLELAAEAKKKKDAGEDKMRSLHQKLEATCKACHDVYQ